MEVLIGMHESKKKGKISLSLSLSLSPSPSSFQSSFYLLLTSGGEAGKEMRVFAFQ
jgi:hypothetical protein